MKLNNKGFAITAVLYGLLILFVILVSSYLLILSSKKNRLDIITKDIEDRYNGIYDTNTLLTDEIDLIKDYNIVSDDLVDYVKENIDINYIEDGEEKNISTLPYEDDSGEKFNIVVDVGQMEKDYLMAESGIKIDIRYSGSNPFNYVLFNCNDYSNQSVDTCEKWRIIGIVDDKIKLMRSESIGEYSWDTSDSSKNNGMGINQWSETSGILWGAYEGADLMRLLNPKFDGTNYAGTNGSLYWNSQKGECYSGQNNATKECDFTNVGLKNNETRNMIASAYWHLGGYDKWTIEPNKILWHEKSTDTSRNNGGGNDTYSRTTGWSGKVAVPYPSDYGYAVDTSVCDTTFDNYKDSNCYDNNWMAQMFNKSLVWLLTPRFGPEGTKFSSWFVNTDGTAQSTGEVFNVGNVYPVIYLEDGVDIALNKGNGTYDNPYQLEVSNE